MKLPKSTSFEIISLIKRSMEDTFEFGQTNIMDISEYNEMRDVVVDSNVVEGKKFTKQSFSSNISLEKIGNVKSKFNHTKNQLRKKSSTKSLFFNELNDDNNVNNSVGSNDFIKK